MTKQNVEMYIDPACPWAWLTSRWLYEAEQVRPFEVTTRFFSLAAINRKEGEENPVLEALEKALRVLVAARRAGGEQAVRSLYTALGTAIHEDTAPVGDDVLVRLRDAVTAAGLDPELVDQALADPATQAELDAEHAAIVERGAFGVPTLTVDGSAPYFGPVVDTRITGEEAGKLWDVVLPLLVHPRVFELKRTRTGQPDIGRNRAKAAAAAD